MSLDFMTTVGRHRCTWSYVRFNIPLNAATRTESKTESRTLVMSFIELVVGKSPFSNNRLGETGLSYLRSTSNIVYPPLNKANQENCKHFNRK